MSMEINQLTQMTTWLDEEHRRDKAELIRLQQRLESQEGQVVDQAHTIQDLEDAWLACSPAPQIRPARSRLRELKDEVTLLLQQRKSATSTKPARPSGLGHRARQHLARRQRDPP